MTSIMVHVLVDNLKKKKHGIQCTIHDVLIGDLSGTSVETNVMILFVGFLIYLHVASDSVFESSLDAQCLYVSLMAV